MKKVLLSGIVIVAFGSYVFFQHNTNSPALPSQNNASSTSSRTPSKGASQTNGAYKDGEYAGSAVDAFYGTIQVKAVIQNGKVSDVQFLQFPSDQRESQEVSQMAMPILKQEAIQTQSAQVDTVSGATQTSQAFKESLADALLHAK